MKKNTKLVRKVKLTKYGKTLTKKVILTILLAVFSIIIYSKVGEFGELAQTHKGYQLVCIGSWFWLLAGQLFALSYLWGEQNGSN